MKRRTIVLVIVAAIMCCMLTACETGPSSNSVDSSAISSASFKAIDDTDIHILHHISVKMANFVGTSMMRLLKL